MTSLRNSLRRGAFKALLVVPMLALAPACTDLTVEPDDALTPGNAFKTEGEILAGVASVYANLRGTMWGWYNLSEISTDEMIVPTRGNDWFDNGRWLEIYRQTWTSSSGSALDDMNGTWNTLFAGVARANLMISVLEGQAPSATRDQTIAELRVLRAWYYYELMDLFGGVPLVTGTQLAQTPRVSRDSLFKFVEKELTEAGAKLPDTWGSSGYGRVTKGAADAILASMYINAPVFTGTVTTNGLTPGRTMYAEAIAAADRVINSSAGYQLNPNWKGNFSSTNEGSKENIFVIVHSSVAGLGMSLPMRTLHYNSVTTGNGGPWNGFAAIAETYRAFDPADQRRDIFLVGPQFSFDDGRAINDRAGARLIFTDTIGNADAAAENEGPRYNKFPPTSGVPNGDSHPNDFPLFRLAEMYLIKAEALARQNQVAPAMIELNRIHSKNFTPPQTLVATTQQQALDLILKERLLEFTGEAKRRQDLIRFGKYTDARRFKTAQQGYKILFPIPSTQIGANPLLDQNPGY